MGCQGLSRELIFGKGMRTATRVQEESESQALVKEEGRGTRNGHEASEGSKGISGL